MRIDVDGVTKRLGDVVAVDDVDLSVPSGTFVALVGPNGAGKTTLMRAVNGAIEPDAGTVSVGGEDVHALSSKATSRRVATVPQDTAVTFEFTVREVVAMGRHPHRPRFGADPDPGAVDAALATAQVDHLADRSVSAVSGGERQRVLLARALAQDAQVLLLDEPTASLDVNHQVRTLELVRGLVDDAGRTVVAAIHDLNLAARFADRLVLLADGSVVDSGTPEAVLTGSSLGDAFGTRTVVQHNPVTGTPYVTPLADRERRDVRVHVIGGGGAAAPLLADLAAADVDATVGVVPEGDRDHDAARAFGFEAVTVPAFSSVTDAAAARARGLAAQADVVVLADVDLDGGARPNLSLAAETDTPVVVVEDRPVGARNPDDGVRSTYEAVRDRGVVVPSDDVLSGVEQAVDAPPIEGEPTAAGD